MKGTLRLFLTLCVTVLSMTLVQAQERTYTGTVSSAEDGSPVIGANVEVVGTTQGTSTGVDGTYSIRARSGSQLRFSFLGMQEQIITVGNATVVNVVLAPDATGIDQVVVVAYGTAKKKDLTGSLTSVNTRLLEQQSNSTVSRALEGAVPGLQLASIDGAPGLDMGIRLRGLSSATQNASEALIVIDGVPQINNRYSGFVGASPLASINQKDIETISVLKDAASAALYGSRGANGVILINTKRGQRGDAKVQFEGRWGINQIGPFNFDRVSDPKDWYEYVWLSTYNTIRYQADFSHSPYTTNVQNPNFSDQQARELASQHLFNFNGVEFDANGKATGIRAGDSPNPALGNWLLYKVPGMTITHTQKGTANQSGTLGGNYLVGTDGKLNPEATLLFHESWEDIFFKNRFRQEYNVNVSGATDKVDYYISAGYLNDPSYVVGSGMERYNARANVNVQVNKWLKAGMNLAYTQRRTNYLGNTRGGRNAGSNAGNIFRNVYGQNPLQPFYAYDMATGVVKTDEVTGEKQVLINQNQVDSPLGPVGLGYSPSAGYDMLKVTLEDNGINKTVDLTARGYVEARFLKDFTARVEMNVDDTYNWRNRYLRNEQGGLGYDPNGGGSSTLSKQINQNLAINTQQIINWSHDYGKHHVDAMAGHEFNRMKWEDVNWRMSYALLSNFDAPVNFLAFNGGGGYASHLAGMGSDLQEEASEGYFFRANYNYDSKYYLSASVRHDGSSKFKYKDNRWGTFWSLGGSWRISSESFMEDISWINDLRLRASYGVIGNQGGVDRYSGYQSWSWGASGWAGGAAQAGTPSGYTISMGAWVNDQLSWENLHQLDIGLEFTLWDRFYGSIDYYRRVTHDMIWNTPIAYSLGQATMPDNTAKMRNSGIEFDLGVDIIKNQDFFWNFTVNGTHYRNKLLEVPVGVGVPALDNCWIADIDGWGVAGGAGAGGAYLRGVGKDMYNLYFYRYKGVDQTTGLPLFDATVTDLDHQNGVFSDHAVGTIVETSNVTLADRYEMGSATPDFMGGFSTSFRWKNLDFTAQFAYQIGGKYLSVDYGNFLYRSEIFGNYHPVSSELQGNTWTPTNTAAKFPMQFLLRSGGYEYTNGATLGSWAYSDMTLFDCSYLNVKNLTLGYNFPKKWMDAVGIEGVRAYVSADNVWMLTTHAGFDPRMSIAGGLEVGAYSYPFMRTFSLGLNVTF